MLQRFQGKVGTAGLIVAIVALVAALGGGAYAASGGLTGKQKKEVETIAKKYAGKPGKQGPAGAQGTAGAPGAKGEAGIAGSAGASGANGKSVSVTSIPVGTSGACEATGGAKVAQEGSTSGVEVCTGEEGPEGPAGEPWTVGGLPSGKTEMGTWSVGPLGIVEVGGEELPVITTAVFSPLSFTVPLAQGATVAVHYVRTNGEEEVGKVKTGPSTACTGNAKEPTKNGAPAPGVMCVYAQTNSGTHFEEALNPMGGENTAGMAGTNLVFEVTGEGAQGKGDWIATAP